MPYSFHSRSLVPSTRGGILLLVTAFIECAALTSCNAVVFAAKHPSGSIAMTLASCFMLFLAIRVQKIQNTILLFSHLALNTLLIACAALELTESGRGYVGLTIFNTVHHPTPGSQPLDRPMAIASLVTVLVSQVALTYATALCFKDWRWSAIEHGYIGSNSRAFRQSCVYEVYKCLTWHLYHMIAYFLILDLAGGHQGYLVAATVFVVLLVVAVVALQSYALRSQQLWAIALICPFGVAALGLATMAVVAWDMWAAQLMYYQALSRAVSTFSNPTQSYIVKTSVLLWINLLFPIYFTQFILSLLSWHWFRMEGKAASKERGIAATDDEAKIA